MSSALEPVERHARERVEAALADTPVVVVLGARQVGKSTLVEQIARARGDLTLRTFDDQATRETAQRDPTGWVAGLPTPAAIDEVQRVPDVLLAIKQRVDRDRAAGQFLLTGSANILTAPRIADALTGRAEYVRLHPFTQGELRGRREAFIETLFAGEFPQLSDRPIGRSAYAPMIAAGGYPESVKRTPPRRVRFFESYLATIMERDLRSIAALSDGANARRLLQAIAAVSASELNFQALSRDLGLANNTLRSYADLLETLFLMTRIPPWSGNLFARAIKAPKAYIADPGLLAYLVGANEHRIEHDLPLGGSLFETFTATELLRQADAQDDPVQLHHYRDRDQREVDLIIERRDGTVIAIEVKAAASIRRGDTRGLNYMRDKLGPRFIAGALLYTGPNTLPAGERIAAIPLSGLWET
ncbi:MAG: ATP-binding protein [Solirubrobacteraceae bacterium]